MRGDPRASSLAPAVAAPGSRQSGVSCRGEGRGGLRCCVSLAWCEAVHVRSAGPCPYTLLPRVAARLGPPSHTLMGPLLPPDCTGAQLHQPHLGAVPHARGVVARPAQRRAIPGARGRNEEALAAALWLSPKHKKRTHTRTQARKPPLAPPVPVDVQQSGLAAVALPKGEELKRHALAVVQALGRGEGGGGHFSTRGPCLPLWGAGIGPAPPTPTPHPPTDTRPHHPHTTCPHSHSQPTNTRARTLSAATKAGRSGVGCPFTAVMMACLGTPALLRRYPGSAT